MKRSRWIRTLTLLAAALLVLPSAARAAGGEDREGTSLELALPEARRAPVFHPTGDAPELQALRARAGGQWMLTRNTETGTAHAVWGSGIPIPFAEGAAPPALEKMARRFIDENPELFGVASTDLRLEFARTRAGKTSLIFQQTWRDVPVWGARVHVVFHENGRIMAFGSDARRGIQVSTRPAIDRAAAFDQARTRLGAVASADDLGADLWIVHTGGADRLVWRALVSPAAGEPAWAQLVDARDGGVLASEKLSYDTDVAGTVTGSADWITPCDGVQNNMPFADLLVDLQGGGSGYTNASGLFVIPNSGDDPFEATAMLRGRYADVRNSNGADAAIVQTVTPGALASFVWSDANSTPAERDTYQFTNDLRSYLHGIDPTFVAAEYDFPLRSNVNAYFGSFNASWSWDGAQEVMAFCRERLDIPTPFQNSGRMGEVIYHEFGHSLTAHVYGGPAAVQPNLSLHEGNSDVVAVLFAQNPLIGRGWDLSDCNSSLRTADNTLQYPGDYEFEGHANGRILVGVYWDIYDFYLQHGWNGDLARDTVMQFWHDGRMLGLPQTFPDQVYWTYIADDNDGNLANGTPHSTAIDYGAIGHGFQPLTELVAAQGLFSDVTTPALAIANGAGTAWGDFDGDGDDDLFVASNEDDAGLESHLLRNDAGTFVDVTPSVLSLNLCLAAAWGDYDRDGDQDLAVTTSTGVRLFRNTAGTFADVSPGSFAAATSAPAAAWVDYDKDGDLDLHVATTLFRNDGSGAFSEVTGQPVSGVVGASAAAWTDFDRDGDSDVFITTFGVGSKLCRNNGNGTFTDVTPTVLQLPEGAMAAAWGDADNDGDPDLVTSSWLPGGKTRFFRYNSGTSFTEILDIDLNGSKGWSVEWVDYDNDGRLDLYVAGFATNTLLHNDGANSFTDMSADPIWNAAMGSSAGWSDYDGDGDLDVFLANLPAWDSVVPGWTYVEQGCRLLRNENANGNKWLEVDLVGIASNRDGVGARLKLLTSNGAYYRQGSGGGNHATQNSRTIHFGLGSATAITGLKVTWPSGKQSIVSGIALNSRITVVEPTDPPPPNFEMSTTEEVLSTRLLGGSPNPFRGATSIRFSLAEAADATLGIFDVSGRRVREAFAGTLPAGFHEWSWDGRDDQGRTVGNGIYYVRFLAPGISETTRIVMLR